MIRFCFPLLIGSILACVVVDQVRAQRPGLPNPDQDNGKSQSKPPPLPDDQRLLLLHKEFVIKAEKLAREYERKKQWDKAEAVYREVLKLVPQHEISQAKMRALFQRASNAEVVPLTIAANQGWQDTGIEVLQGQPITISAAGMWTFNLKKNVTAEGIAIPKELRDYNLGCLLGAVRSSERRGLQGGTPTDFVRDMKRLSDKQAEMREKAKKLARQLDTETLTGRRLNQTIKMMQSVEDDLRDLREDAGSQDMEPFVVGPQSSFVAERTGRLYLRMHGASEDGEGALDVKIRGSFIQRNR